MLGVADQHFSTSIYIIYASHYVACKDYAPLVASCNRLARLLLNVYIFITLGFITFVNVLLHLKHINNIFRYLEFRKNNLPRIYHSIITFIVLLDNVCNDSNIRAFFISKIICILYLFLKILCILYYSHQSPKPICSVSIRVRT